MGPAKYVVINWVSLNRAGCCFSLNIFKASNDAFCDNSKLFHSNSNSEFDVRSLFLTHFMTLKFASFFFFVKTG